MLGRQADAIGGPARDCVQPLQPGLIVPQHQRLFLDVMVPALVEDLQLAPLRIEIIGLPVVLPDGDAAERRRNVVDPVHVRPPGDQRLRLHQLVAHPEPRDLDAGIAGLRLGREPAPDDQRRVLLVTIDRPDAPDGRAADQHERPHENSEPLTLHGINGCGS